MSTKTYGTTSVCREWCDTLIASNRGIKRHEYILEVCALDAKEAITHGEKPARVRAWAEVYGKSKYDAPTAHRRLGLGKVRGKESPVSHHAAHESYKVHHGPTDQAIVARQAEAEVDLLDIIKAIGRVDIADFFDLGEDEDEPDALLSKAIRWIHEGVRDKSTHEPLERHELLGSGVIISYDRRQRPPLKTELLALFRRIGGDQLKPMRQLKAEGLSKYIANWYRGKDGIQFKILYEKAYNLEAAMTGRLSTTLNLNDAQAGQDRYEEAVGEGFRLVAPELSHRVEPALTAAAWFCGADVTLVKGEGRVTRAPGQALRWTGEKLVVESHLKLLKVAS